MIQMMKYMQSMEGKLSVPASSRKESSKKRQGDSGDDDTKPAEDGTGVERLLPSMQVENVGEGLLLITNEEVKDPSSKVCVNQKLLSSAKRQLNVLSLTATTSAESFLKSYVMHGLHDDSAWALINLSSRSIKCDALLTYQLMINRATDEDKVSIDTKQPSGADSSFSKWNEGTIFMCLMCFLYYHDHMILYIWY
jgi:hypothetical protein